MSLYEKDFEAVIYDSLSSSPLYVGRDDKDGSYTKGDYSRELLCDVKLLGSYLEQTQPLAWKKLQKMHPGQEAAAVAAEVNKLRGPRGLLELLRNGFSLAGVGKVELVTFKPATGSSRVVMEIVVLSTAKWTTHALRKGSFALRSFRY